MIETCSTLLSDDFLLIYKYYEYNHGIELSPVAESVILDGGAISSSDNVVDISIKLWHLRAGRTTCTGLLLVLVSLIFRGSTTPALSCGLFEASADEASVLAFV